MQSPLSLNGIVPVIVPVDDLQLGATIEPRASFLACCGDDRIDQQHRLNGKNCVTGFECVCHDSNQQGDQRR